MNIKFRVSKKGVPHILVDKEGVTYSICYFGKKDEPRFFRVWNYDTQEKIRDVHVEKDNVVDLGELIK